MNRSLERLWRLAVFTSTVAWILSCAVFAQSTTFRIDRIISGIRLVGTPPNVTVEDVKSVFQVPDDKQVVVYFEWTGAPGTHRFQGIWRDPSGRQVGNSDFEIESSTGKFSGNWKLFLTDKTQPGRWTIESWIDDRIVGRYGIDVRIAHTAASEKPKSVVRLPSLNGIFRKADAATVFVEQIDKNGIRNLTGSGFFVSPNAVVTSFGVIEGASALRLVAGSRTFELAGVVAWNRFQDWAVLRTIESSADYLTIDAKSGQVGERCLALSIGANSERMLTDGLVSGVLSKRDIGDRLTVSTEPLSTEFDSVKDQSTGSPLLNLAGEVVAIAVGPSTILPGSASVGVVRSHNLFESDSPFDGLQVLAVRAKYFSAAVARTSVTSLAQLASAKEFAPALVNSNYVQSGTVAVKADGNGNPVGQAFTFRPAVKELQVFISWNVAEPFDGVAALKVYDENNRLLIDGKPQKMRSPAASIWVVHAASIPLDRLAPGTYRVDYLLNDGPAWRSFFRIIP